MKTRSVTPLAIAIAAGLSSMGAAASASAIDPSTSPATSDCVSAARELLQENGVDSTVTAVDYMCGLGQVSVTAPAPNGSERTFTEAVAESESNALAAQAIACDPAQPPTRTIVSELQVNIHLCVVYGQENSPTNGTWARSIDVDWTVYPGWNSSQSAVSTIPSEGSPALTGTITSQRQNGVLPPTELSSAFFNLNGNDAATGYVVGGLNTGGSHSVKMADLEVTDPTYSFNAVIGDGETTPRFTCDTEQQRCYYPNGEEASL